MVEIKGVTFESKAGELTDLVDRSFSPGLNFFSNQDSADKELLSFSFTDLCAGYISYNNLKFERGRENKTAIVKAHVSQKTLGGISLIFFVNAEKTKISVFKKNLRRTLLSFRQNRQEMSGLGKLTSFFRAMEELGDCFFLLDLDDNKIYENRALIEEAAKKSGGLFFVFCRQSVSAVKTKDKPILFLILDSISSSKSVITKRTFLFVLSLFCIFSFAFGPFMYHSTGSPLYLFFLLLGVLGFSSVFALSFSLYKDVHCPQKKAASFSLALLDNELFVLFGGFFGVFVSYLISKQTLASLSLCLSVFFGFLLLFSPFVSARIFLTRNHEKRNFDK